MKRCHITLALLCTLALSASVPRADAGVAAAKAVIEVAKDGIETLDKALDLYNKILDKVIPWSEMNATITKLDQFRSDYSEEAADLLGDIKTKMLDGMDAYFRSTETIYQWSGLAINALKLYKKLFNGDMTQKKFATQRKILLEILGKGKENMENAKNELYDSEASFNDAAGKLTKLNNRLTIDFDENSDYYQSQKNHIRLVAYGSAAPFGLLGISIAAGVVEAKLIPELNAKMASILRFYEATTEQTKKAAEDIASVKNKLKDEIRIIGNLQQQTESTELVIEMDSISELKDDVVEAVDNLVIKCKEYRERHFTVELTE